MITVLLSAYNEGASLPVLFQKLKEVLEQLNLSYRILVCNDGSDDQTDKLLDQLSTNFPIEVISHKIN